MFACRFAKYFIRRPFHPTHSTSLRKIPLNRSRECLTTFTITRTFRIQAKNAGKKLGRSNVQRNTGKVGFDLRKSALAGGSVFGLGALCIYGLKVVDKPGSAMRISSIIWPDFVKQRIRDTYLYFGSSLVVTSLAAVRAFRSPVLLTMVTRTGFFPVLGSLIALIGTQVVCTSIPYKPGFGLKQITWLLHSITVGAFLAPLCILGGPLLTRAAWYTAGIVGGLSVVAYCAPSHTFLYMAGPLAMGLGVVIAASIGSMFLAPTGGLLGASLYSISLYGGLFIMAAFVLFDTQRIVTAAETHLDTIDNLYDPVNMSISIYLATINIFVRIVALMAGSGGGSQKKK